MQMISVDLNRGESISMRSEEWGREGEDDEGRAHTYVHTHYVHTYVHTYAIIRILLTPAYTQCHIHIRPHTHARTYIHNIDTYIDT
jgi:hypothetical protein